jgi:MFS family permease
VTRTLHPTLQALAIPNVRWLLASRFSSRLARSLIAAMLAYHVFVATGSYASLGLLGLTEFLPVIPVSLLGGTLADRFDRKRLLVSSHAAALAGAGVLAWFGSQAPDNTAALFVVAFLLAIAEGFAAPAGSSLLPNLVPRELFQNATVLSSGIVQVAFISGPIAMGWLVEPFGFGAPYTLALALYGVSIAGLLGVRTPRAAGQRTPVSWRSVREGIDFVRHNQPILGSITLDMFAVIFAGVTALLPVYAEEILEVGPRGYGLLRSSIGLGTFAMALILMTRKPFTRPGRALLIAVCFFGVATIVFGLSDALPLSMAAMAIAGMADQISMTTRSVILQLSTPDALRGRVNSVNMIFIGASNELGEAESGFLASLTSAVFSVVAGGVICLGVVGITTARMPALRTYEPEGQPPLEK